MYPAVDLEHGEARDVEDDPGDVQPQRARSLALERAQRHEQAGGEERAATSVMWLAAAHSRFESANEEQAW